jgi:hypothetical protein
MINRIKEWFEDEFNALHVRINKLDHALNNAPQLTPEYLSTSLIRSLLKLKDFSHITKLDDLSAQERADYVAAASVVYQTQAFKDIIAEIQQDQMKFAVLNSDIGEAGQAQLMFTRGAINGADLIEQRMAELHSEHLKNTNPDKPLQGMEQHQVIGDI